MAARQEKDLISTIAEHIHDNWDKDEHDGGFPMEIEIVVDPEPAEPPSEEPPQGGDPT